MSSFNESNKAGIVKEVIKAQEQERIHKTLHILAALQRHQWTT